MNKAYCANKNKLVNIDKYTLCNKCKPIRCKTITLICDYAVSIDELSTEFSIKRREEKLKRILNE